MSSDKSGSGAAPSNASPIAAIQKWVDEQKIHAQQVSTHAKTMEIPTGQELMFVNIAYLGAFSLVALLLPSLAMTVYGGDGSPYYSADWVRCAAAGSISLAFLAVIAQRWMKNGTSADALADVQKVFVVYYGLAGAVNLIVALYGSLSILCFINAVVCAALAYAHLGSSQFIQFVKGA
jgi:hypothetical protein